MARHSAKDRIVTSTATLFVVMAVAAACWMLTGNLEDWTNWAGYVATIVVMASLRHMSNGNALMRTRTWMVPAMYVLLSGVVLSVHAVRPAHAAVVAYAFSQFYLFQSYQEYHAERQTMAAFFFLGVASVVCPPLLLLSVTYVIAMTVQLRTLSLRTLLAALFGLTTPLELYAGYLVATGQMQQFFSEWQRWMPVVPGTMLPLNVVQMVNLGVVAMVFLMGCLHFWKTNFNDKIRTRLCFYIIIVQTWVLTALTVVYPQYYDSLLLFVLMESSPVTGHYLVFSQGKVAQIFFYLVLAIAAALLVFNVWTQSLFSF